MSLQTFVGHTIPQTGDHRGQKAPAVLSFSVDEDAGLADWTLASFDEQGQPQLYAGFQKIEPGQTRFKGSVQHFSEGMISYSVELSDLGIVGSYKAGDEEGRIDVWNPLVVFEEDTPVIRYVNMLLVDIVRNSCQSRTLELDRLPSVPPNRDGAEQALSPTKPGEVVKRMKDMCRMDFDDGPGPWTGCFRLRSMGRKYSASLSFDLNGKRPSIEIEISEDED